MPPVDGAPRSCSHVAEDASRSIRLQSPTAGHAAGILTCLHGPARLETSPGRRSAWPYRLGGPAAVAPSPACYPWRAALPCAILKPQVTTAGRRDRTGCLCHRGSDDVCRRGNRCANPIYCHAASGIAPPKRIESLSPFARRSQAPRFRTVLARFAPVRTSCPVPEVAPAGSGAARNGFAVLHSRFGPAGARAS